MTVPNNAYTMIRKHTKTNTGIILCVEVGMRMRKGVGAAKAVSMWILIASVNTRKTAREEGGRGDLGKVRRMFQIIPRTVRDFSRKINALFECVHERMSVEAYECVSVNM